MVLAVFDIELFTILMTLVTTCILTLLATALDSCRDHIEQLYGEESLEIARFEALQDSVREAAGWEKVPDETAPSQTVSSLARNGSQHIQI